MDTSGDRLLSFNEFAKGLLDERLVESVEDCRALFRVFDSDCTGSICYREMLAACCGSLTERRRSVVMNVFRSLDPAGIGAVRLTELLGAFDARAHPAARIGQRSVEDVQQEFSGFFNVGPRGRHVSLAEFELFYAAVSTSIDDDRQFDSAVQDAWQLPGELFT
jgi:hypothetical protein